MLTTSTVFCLRLRPTPQVAEQGPHTGDRVGVQEEDREGEVEGEEVVELETVEGQGGRSHSSVWSSSPTQSAPPFTASWRTLLVLVLSPAPQLVEQSDHTE